VLQAEGFERYRCLRQLSISRIRTVCESPPCRRVALHALRVTPAMEAGLTDHVWSLGELAGLLSHRAGARNFGFCGHATYLPMQKVPKIRFRMSSVVVAPVISSSGRRAA
jgi:hypothetical protein